MAAKANQIRLSGRSLAQGDIKTLTRPRPESAAKGIHIEPPTSLRPLFLTHVHIFYLLLGSSSHSVIEFFNHVEA
jgi:hypothetical protein